MQLFDTPIWSVSDLTRFIRKLFENEPVLQDVWVEGEVSNVSRPASGHLYFTLKDRGAALRCVMWRTQVMQQTYHLQNGDAVEIHGSVSVYDAGGNYQLYADLIRPAGQGVLYQEFLRLKAQLEAEGLFDDARKRLLPQWPKLIGIVTSPTGAALRDMQNTIRRRYPLVEVIVAPSAVQGVDAPVELLAAIRALHRLDPQPDVILIARGGGSMEDLWAFNDERVVRAVAAAEIPVVSGVGHETDFTLIDFAADVRAPTPTAAAEIVTPDQFELNEILQEYRSRLDKNVLKVVESLGLQFNNIMQRLYRGSPLIKVSINRQRIDDIERRLLATLRYSMHLRMVNLEGVSQKLKVLNPQAILRRGYAVVLKLDGTLVRSVAQVKPADTLRIQVSDGEFGVQVEDENKFEE